MNLEINNTIDGKQGLKWGSSLPVPSVQDIVRTDPICVPERYIRNSVDRPTCAKTCSLLSEIPVIDFSLLSEGHDGEQRKLDLACKEWGFFQIVHHGITENTLHRIRNAMVGFFDLPIEEKNKYAMAANDLQGYGQAYVVSKEQKLDWNDIMFLMTLPTEERKLSYWPTEVHDFKEAVEIYSEEVHRVAVELLSHLSLLMNMNQDGLLRLHDGIKIGMRMNYYPPCCRPDEVLGVSPHSDGGSITILLQDDDIVGLQIKHKGDWLPVKPIPQALVVNIGDAIEAWSNGAYKSIEHRAVTNEAKSRMSLAAFVVPNENVEIGPLDQMIDDAHRPKMYRTTKYLDYIRHTLGRKMEGKEHMHFLKLDHK
ncbi:protein SRG1-like [Canna indica]|uniref:Protein SRG1-like n=1 Tax=Canna indica TaxID=4628 RepID=A0AAQ3KK72_9LILI|nr:protein SRG1-like [Canna indica]